MREISEVIYRHVGDASFYWNQLDKMSYSNTISLNGVLYFEKILTSHLDGIFEAQEVGWNISLDQLKRWRGAGEIFICSLLAFSSSSELSTSRWNTIEKILEIDPSKMLRGVISAILRLDSSTARKTDRRFNRMRPSIAPRKRHQAG